MTIIVGVVYDGRVHLGADSMVTAGWLKLTSARAKVFTNGPAVFGVAGAVRAHDVLHYALDVPRRFPGDDLDKWLRTTFVNAVRSAFRDAGALKVTNGVETFDGVALVGISGRLVQLGGDFSVTDSAAPYAAVGSGSEVALGAMHAAHGNVYDASGQLGMALRAAAEYAYGCRGPFTYADEPRPEGS